LQVYTREAFPSDWATTGNNLGLAYASLGKADQAITFYERSLEIARRIGDKSREGNILSNLGLVYAQSGETSQAIEFYERALAIAKEIGDQAVEGNAFGNLGLASIDLGDINRAVKYFEIQLHISSEIGDLHGQKSAHENLGDAYFLTADFDMSIRHYQKALGITQELNDPGGQANLQFLIGLSYLEMGMPSASRKNLEFALQLYKSIGSPRSREVSEFIEKAIAQEKSDSNAMVNTGGGAYISGSINVAGGDYVGRDKIVQGDEVYGDKISGDKIQIGGGWLQITNLERLTPAVCRGELRDTYFTAFLVGPDIILTAYRTIEVVLDGRMPPSDLTFRFDLVTTAASEILSQGQAYALAVGREAEKRFESQHPWLVAADETLDYAFLRLARPAGEEVPGGLRAGRARGWLTLAEEAHLSSGDPLGTILLRRGAQFDVLYEENAFVENLGHQFIHRLDTAPGASGAPIFNVRREVVGLHQARPADEAYDLPKAAFAVFVPAVVADLRQTKLWPLS
jgi:tetratricopeptide (TPR) repeat protein